MRAHEGGGQSVGRPHPGHGQKRMRSREGSKQQMTEITFEVAEDEIDRDYSASTIAHGIHTHGDSMEDTQRHVRVAIDLYFDEATECPRVIRLLANHMVLEQAQWDNRIVVSSMS